MGPNKDRSDDPSHHQCSTTDLYLTPVMYRTSIEFLENYLLVVHDCIYILRDV